MNRKKIKVLNPNNLPTLNYTDIEDFQGDLKTITIEDTEKLAKLILEFDFFKSKTVFLLNGKHYMADGHQTKRALQYLETVGIDGVKYEIPEIPVEIIPVKSKTEAAKKLLAINSSFGKLNEKTTFFTTFKIDKTDFEKFSFENKFKGFEGFNFESPNIDLQKIGEVSSVEDIEDLNNEAIKTETDNDSDFEDENISPEQIKEKELTNFVIRYDLIFDDESQQETFYKFLKLLKDKYPDNNTIASRINQFILDNTNLDG